MGKAPFSSETHYFRDMTVLGFVMYCQWDYFTCDLAVLIGLSRQYSMKRKKKNFKLGKMSYIC